MSAEEEEVAAQRRLAERVLGQPVRPVLKAAFEDELPMAIAAGDEARVRELERLILACDEEAEE